MRNIAKIALIVFVSMLEVGYAVDCREGLYEKYKAHSAEFIKLKNKCKPLQENVKRLADEYKNTIAYKEYEVIRVLTESAEDKDILRRIEIEEEERIFNQCINSPEHKSQSKREGELIDINFKTQAYKAYKQAEKALHIEIDATCKLFFDGVYDIDRAFERIAKATYKSDKAEKVWRSTPQNKAAVRAIYNEPYSFVDCMNKKGIAKSAYYKALETAEKALEPLETAFRNSPEVKEYVAECRGITFSDKEMPFSFHGHSLGPTLYWEDAEEKVISYIQSIIANSP